MELKNNFSVTKEEASNLLNNLANSLKNRGKFEISLPNQEISLDIGEELNATLIISDTRFSVDFMWKGVTDKKADVDWRDKFDKDMADAGLPIADGVKGPVAAKPVASLSAPPIPGPKTKGPIPANTIPPISPTSTPEIQTKDLGPRKLKEQMILETTTLPYEGGVWNPAFTLTHENTWTEIGIDNQLENTKWISDADLVSFDAPGSPRQAPSADDDDLFTKLDAEDPLSSRPSGRKTTRQTVTPAAMVFNPSPSNLDDASIAEAAAEWREPGSEENTGDEWVKPSEVIQKKKEKAAKIAKGKKSKTVTPTRSRKKAGKDNIEWNEPESEGDTTDEWVKPSEFLKQKNKKTEVSPQPPIPKKAQKKKKDATSKKTRPPPVAPDNIDDDSKGWASWKD